jgi:hypothetical protein
VHAFLMGVLKSAASQASNDVHFSYAPSDYATGENRFDVPRLREDFLRLIHKVTWKALQPFLRGGGGAGDDVGASAEGGEAEAEAEVDEAGEEAEGDEELVLQRGFEQLFGDRATAARMLRLYWWGLQAYRASFRVVTPDRLRDYFLRDRQGR